jgi:peptidyl-prolyl cis-trans isomerase B (cyclophilin B)
VTSKRDRDLERAKAQRQAERQAKEAAARRQRWLLGGGAAVLAILVVGAVALAMGDEAETTNPAPSPTPGATSTATNDAQGIDCADPGELQTQAQQFPDGPEGVSADRVPEGATVGLKLTTNCGEIEIELLPERTPRNFESILFLANTGAPKCDPPGADCSGENPTGEVLQVQGYWDNTTCHRLTSSGIFVLQCGDPTGTGTGGPGFTTPDEDLDSLTERFDEAGDGAVVYPRGTVAMANSGPDTNGSQFFLVYDDSPLPPAYTVVGTVTEGLDIIDAVAEGGSTPEGDGEPNQTLELEKVLSFERTEIQQ